MRRLLVAIVIFQVGCPRPAGPAHPANLDAGYSDADAASVTVDTGDDTTNDTGILADADATSDAADASDLGDAGCAEAPTRGAWMYRHPGNPLGTDAVVGASAEEASAIANLAAYQVERVYGNYGSRPVAEPSVIGAWNAQLDAAGIDSQVLVGAADDIFPGCRDEMLARVQARLIDFNAGVAASEQFDALHLDIEPQQYKQGAAFPTTTSCGLRVPNWPYWDDLDDAGRAERYQMLLTTLQEVRGYLDSHGHASTELYVDLAPWIDSSPNFDWGAVTGIADGADWMSQAASTVDGMTMMTYERDTASLIDASVSGEASLQTALRVSVNAKERAPLSSTTTWTDLNAMFGVVEQLEQTHCGARPVDLFNYRYLLE